MQAQVNETVNFVVDGWWIFRGWLRRVQNLTHLELSKCDFSTYSIITDFFFFKFLSWNTQTLTHLILNVMKHFSPSLSTFYNSHRIDAYLIDVDPLRREEKNIINFGYVINCLWRSHFLFLFLKRSSYYDDHRRVVFHQRMILQ